MRAFKFVKKSYSGKTGRGGGIFIFLETTPYIYGQSLVKFAKSKLAIPWGKYMVVLS